MRPHRYYVCRGKVRGDCGHAHRTLAGALACLRRDARGCRRQSAGGYTDREVWHIEGPAAYSVAAGEDSAVAEDLATLLESDDWPVQMLVLAAPRSDARRLALDVRYCLEGK